jgi:hypothetical protein
MIFGVRPFQFYGGTSFLTPSITPSQIILLYVIFYFNHVHCLCSSSTWFLATYKINTSLEVYQCATLSSMAIILIYLYNHSKYQHTCYSLL